MIVKQLACSVIGSLEWKMMRKKYGYGSFQTPYIFFPDDNAEYTVQGLKILNTYAEKNRIQRVVLVFEQGKYQAAHLDNLNFSNYETVIISEFKMYCLMKYYALIDMSEIWISVSAKKPYDTYAENLLGYKGTTISDIVAYDVFKLDENPLVTDLGND